MPHWDWRWCAEIEKYPSDVMAARHPKIINLGNVLATEFIDRAKMLGPIDVLAGGPPCQGFSIAGLRGGMSDPRGNLTLQWAQMIHAIQPRNAVTENVPGWLSMSDNAFGCFLAALVGADAPLLPPDRGEWHWKHEPLFGDVTIDGETVHREIPSVGGEWQWTFCRWSSAGMVSGPLARVAWRIFDAQFFGLAQRRKRVFVIADFGNGADPAAILFERQGLLGNTPPRRKKRKDVAPTLAARTRGGGGLGTDFDLDGGLISCAELAPTLNAHFGEKQGLDDQHINGGGGYLLPSLAMCLNAGAMARQDAGSETLIPTNRCGIDVAEAIIFKPSHFTRGKDGAPSDVSPPLSADADKGDQDSLVCAPIAFPERLSGTQYASAENLAPSLGSMNPTAVAFAQNQRDEVRVMDVAGALAAEPGMKQQTYVSQDWAVRRLTPVECARLQGFPDDYLDIKFRGKPAADSSKYKALGNSWAVNCGRWILERVERFMPPDSL
jgi:DNA (cytosine-5)-methyltransferase 1